MAVKQPPVPAPYPTDPGYPTNPPYPTNPAYPAPGYPTSGYPAPGYPAPGYPAPGYPAPGYPTPGYPAPGYPTSGYPTQGYPTDPGYVPYPTVYQGQLETPFPPNSPYLAGSISAAVIERGGNAPNTIIRTDTDWYVDLHWSLSGLLVPMICGRWSLHVYLESMGPGEELRLPGAKEIFVPVDPCGDGKYHYQFDVPKGTVKPEHCSIPYKLVATISYHNKCGWPGCMAGFVEGPMLQFYEAHKKSTTENGYPTAPHNHE